MPAPTLVVGAPCWIDLYSSDTDKAKEFYGQLLGWTTEESAPEFGGYFTFLKDGKHVAGCMANDGTWVSGRPDRLPDDGRRRPHRRAGRERRPGRPRADGRGRERPHGDGRRPRRGRDRRLAAGEHEGVRRRSEVGAASWFELHTRDYDKSVAFYRDVFGRDAHAMSDAPEFRYIDLGEGDGALAGIYDATEDIPQGQPGAWTVYFEVEDVDAALERVAELAARSSGRPRTRRTAGWQRPPTRPAAGSSWSRARADRGAAPAGAALVLIRDISSGNFT